MKIITSSSKTKIIISKTEWDKIGKDAGWITDSTIRTFNEIRDQYEKEGKRHCLRLHCAICNTTETCRCSAPKTDETGVCYDCAMKSKKPAVEAKCKCKKCKSHGVDYGKPKGHLDTQLFPECAGTKYDRNIVEKTVAERKNHKQEK